MFKIGKYILLGVWLMLSIFVASAQTFDYTTPSATAPVDDDANPANDEVEQISSGDKVCPSFLPGFTSTNIFSVPITSSSEAGDQTLNEFVWVVYGGTITAYEGGSLVEAIQTNEVTTGIHRSFVRIRGSNAAGTHSRITVLWDEVDVPGAWVAVQQFSEWNCTEGKWSLFTNEVSNEAPTFDPALVDIHLPYDLRETYTLALPGIDDADNCYLDINGDPVYSYSYVVDRPTLVDLLGTSANLALSPEVLEVGANIVHWTIIDGNKTLEGSYKIIVEPELHILNVAWINPSCGNSNGSAYVSAITDYAFTGDLEYRFDGGTWSGSNSVAGLAAGAHTVQVRAIYNAGTPQEHSQLSAEYAFELHDNATTAIQADGIPSASPDLTLKPTSCGNASDGAISMDPSKMIPQNRSVAFDGIDDHLLLNKKLSGVISTFSVALWVKTTEPSGTLISFDNSEYFNLGFTAGQVQLRSYSTDGVSNIVLVNNLEYVINDGEWHLVVATLDAGVYSIYVDGNLAHSVPGNGEPSIGKVGLSRYGAIGALLKSDVFPGVVQAPFLKGQMAEVAYWERALTPVEMVDMKRLGISNVADKKDHWVLNDTPETISPTQAQVFTDAGNGATGSDWARFYNGPVVSETNAPKLYSWDDDATAMTYERTALAVGDYKLHVRDLFGCANVEKTFTISNGDDEEPYLLWNVSAHKTARQSSIVNTVVCDSLMTAGRAADGWLGLDGCSYTTTLAEAGVESWWDVTLGMSSYPIDRVRIHPQLALNNFYVIISSSDFDAGSTLSADLAKPGVASYFYNEGDIAAGGFHDVLFPTVPSGRYVRIRMANPNEVLSLYEVQVLTHYKPATERKLLLTDVCPDYTISDNDATIDPIPVDGCGNTPDLTHDYSGASLNSTLEGVVWPLGPHTVTWTAKDEKGLETPFEITYHVKDEIKPVFEENPFDGLDKDLTFCDVQETFKFRVPKVTDNYNCAQLVSISLLRDGIAIYSVDMSGYNPLEDELVPALPASMLPGTHTFEWRVVDAQGNRNSISSEFFIQQQPILQEVRVSPVTCNAGAVVYFSKVVYETSKDITYILKKVSDGSELKQDNDPVFTTVPEGVYQAYISVDECRTPTPYFEDIVIATPAAISTIDDMTHVTCYGQNTGAIDMDPQGGSQTNVLHLMGPDTYVLAPGYTDVNLTTTGSVEAWVYLDELVDGGVNWNAGLFGMPNAPTGYGFKMVNGNLTFYVGTESISLTGAITARKWYYILGTWNGTDPRSMTIEVRDQFGLATTDATAPTSDFGATASGSIYLGGLGDGDDTHNLRGFVRNARIWNAVLDPTLVDKNLNMAFPLDPDGHLVANYPVNGSGGAAIVNASNTGANGSVQGTYARQKFAYYWTWTDSDGNPQTSHAEDLATIGAGDYTIRISDPLGCEYLDTKTITTDDKTDPTMLFYSNHERDELLVVGEPIVRYTNQTDWGNAADDCEFVPSDKEFDPWVTDGACDPEYVTLTYELVSGSDSFLGTPPAADAQTLNGTRMTGVMTIKWTATDKSTRSTQNEITYYIVDNKKPTDIYIDEDNNPLTDESISYVSVPTGDCEYQVPNDAFIPTVTDNCGTGTLTNNINGKSNLDGETFPVGTNTIEWTYTDRQFTGIDKDPNNGDAAIPYSISFTHTLVVEDNTPPEVECRAHTVQLDATGKGILNSIDIAGNDIKDNCGNVDQLTIATRNIVTSTMTASQSGTTDNAANAIDGSMGTEATTDSEDNPWWQINLGASHKVLGLRLYSGAVPLENFWVLVSPSNTFTNTGDWTPTGAQFGADVAYAQYYGSLPASGLVALNKVATGQYVRIVLNASNAQVSLAEAEVFATTDIDHADQLEVDCRDIRYIPAANQTIKGTFTPFQVLLTVIDQNFNAGSCLADVTVVDGVGPEVPINEVSIDLPSNGDDIDLNLPANLLKIDGNLSSDNCSSNSELFREVLPNTLVGCELAGKNHTVTFTVYDEYGNFTPRSVVIAIKDNTKPNLIPKTDVPLYIGPDGEYVLKETDLLFDWSDNCTPKADISIDMEPKKVYCSDIGNDTKKITVTATDANNQIETIEVPVAVFDDMEPTFSLGGYTHVIPSSGSAPIYFDQIVPDGSLHDNCTKRENLKLYIRYEAAGGTVDEWCGAGNEGDGATVASNFASKATKITGSEALSGHALGLAYDNLPAGSVSSSDQTYYATNAVSGARTVQYDFAKSYEFERIEALWANIPSADGNSALSHNDTYMPSANITASGGAIANKANVRDGNVVTTMTMETGTAGTDAFWIQYTFSQPIMVANARLRWAAGSQLESNSIVQYYNGSTWETYGTIANNTDHSEIVLINATASITQLRLVYDPVAGTAPALAEWYVYGQACTSYAGREVIAAATTPGVTLVSHSSNYLKSVTASNGINISNVNDNDNTTTYYTNNAGNSGTFAEWVEYEFYAPITFSSTQIYWDGYYYPSASKIQYHNGSSWVDVGTIDRTGGDYRSLSLSGISASRLRVSFTNWGSDETRIFNWRVYGAPCTTYDVPSDLALAPSRSSSPYFNSLGYSTTGGITLGTGVSTTSLSNLNDGQTNTRYNSNNGSRTTPRYLFYRFTEAMYISSTSIAWRQAGNNPTIFIYNGATLPQDESQWTEIGTIGTTTGQGSGSSNVLDVNQDAYYVILRFTLTGWNASGNEAQIYEWTVNGYPASETSNISGCWDTQPATLYNCPTVTTQLPVLAPTTATVQFSNDGGENWFPAINVGVDAFPTSVNNTSVLSGGNPVVANSIKLTFDNPTEGNIGLYEFRTFGRRIPQTGDETVPSACYKYDCTHSNTPQKVYLKAVDESGKEGKDEVVVMVVPYFNIIQLEIKDCGYDGERYYALATGLDGVSVPYNYTWNEVVDYGYNLFANNSGTAITGLPNATGYSTGSQSWINFNTGGVATRTNYSVSLKLEDANSCSDSYNYVFDYDANSTTATSVKERDACVGQEVTYSIEFPTKFAFYYNGTLESHWYNEDGVTPLSTDANFEVLNGGNTNDLYVTGKFLRSTLTRGGTKTGIKYGYKVRQLHFDIVEDIENNGWVVQTKNLAGDQFLPTQRVLKVTGDVEAGGPYWIDPTLVNYSTIGVGERFIRSDDIGTYNDYNMCLETTMFKTTVLDVSTPLIEAALLTNKVLGLWVPINGTGAQPFPICVRDTVTYRVTNFLPVEKESLDWSIVSDETVPVPTGRVLDGGDSDEAFIQVVWDTYTTNPVHKPRLTVKKFNRLGCSDDPAVITHTFTDLTPPVLGDDTDGDGQGDCSSMDITQDNGSGQCGFVFTNLPKPLSITDDCRNRIADYWCEVDLNSDGYDPVNTDDFTRNNAFGNYPVGVHTITWYAKDYSNNTGHCVQTITVVDKEAPRFGNPPVDIDDLKASDLACERAFDRATHYTRTAEDKCEGVVDATATIEWYNTTTGLWEGEDDDNDGNIETPQPPDPKTLAGTIFKLGRSRVTWTATDGVDNTIYDASSDPEGNKSSISFFVTVVDETVPTVVDYLNDYTDGIQLAPITADTDPNESGALFTIVDPAYSGTPTGNVIYYPGYTVVASSASLTNPGNLLGDNCTPVPDLVVEFMSRSDKATNLATEFPVGKTTITWRVSDMAIPANRTTFTQDVVVSDKQRPEFRDNAGGNIAADFAGRTISYCARINHKVPIPRTYWDNVRVESLVCRITNSSGVLVHTQTILRSASPNFTVAGNAYFTYSFNGASGDANYVDPDNGSNFTVTWTATDAAGNSSDDDLWKYILHVEMQPHYVVADVVATPMDCGGGTATITVATSNVNVVGGFRFDRNYGYVPEYSIGLGWQTSNSFDVTQGGEYTIKMRVNGCEAPEAATKTIVAPDAYIISTERKNVVCPEKWEGEVSVSMSGGVLGQLVFNNNSYTAAEYPATKLSTTGAVEAWVYLNSLNDAPFVSKGAAYGLQVDGGSFALYLGSEQVVSPYPIVPKRWYHVSGWWDASGMSISIDGTAATTRTGTFVADATNTEVITLGGANFQGILREARIWDGPVSGAIPDVKIKGDASGLVGFWDMNEGSGTKASNLCRSFGGVATDAFGSDLWESGHPQPGFYTWTKNSNSFSTYGKSNIVLTQLEIGTYTVTYTDPYGCAATAPSFKKVIATDNQLPTFDFSDMLTNALPVDPDECSYTFAASDVVDNYTPVISDATGGSCKFTTTWKVVQDYSKETLFTSTGNETADTKLLNAVLKLIGKNGKNTVYITVEQNGMKSEVPQQYDIFVEDRQPPKPDGRFDEGVSMILNDLGIATYSAAAFNRNSRDNCTKDAALMEPRLAAPTEDELASFKPDEMDDAQWKTAVEFNCDQRGEKVKLYFGVRDESGNWAWELGEGEFNILDQTPPRFIKTSEVLAGVCATVNANGGVPAYTTFDLGDLVLKPGDYYDNCGVTRIEFKLKYLGTTFTPTYNNVWNNEDLGDKMADDASVIGGEPVKFYEGKTEVTFRIYDETGLEEDQLIFTVIVLPKPTPGDGAGGGIE